MCNFISELHIIWSRPWKIVIVYLLQYIITLLTKANLGLLVISTTESQQSQGSDNLIKTKIVVIKIKSKGKKYFSKCC